MENKFKKPDSPFLLLTEDAEGVVSYCLNSAKNYNEANDFRLNLP